MLCLFACEDDKPNPDPGKDPAPTLTYTTQNIAFSSLTGGVTKEVAGSMILKGVMGEKDGYTIKEITLVSSTASAKLSGDKFTLTKVGNIVFNLVLKHSSKQDASIKNCTIVIDKGAAASLTFNKRTKTFASGGSFTTNEILAGVQGSKTGYTLKSIASLTPSGIASVSGTKPNFVLNFTKAGTFTATIVLEHSTKADVTLTSAQFEITSKTLTITGLSNGNAKLYDGTTTATPQGTATLSGKVSGDDVAFANGYPKYSFANKNVGTNKAITVTVRLKGTDAADYQVQALTGLTQTVTKKTLTITGLSSGNDKPYDSTTEAEPQGTPALNGKVSGDVVTFASGYPKYNFADKDIGNNKTITVTTNLAGTDAGNYEVQTLTGLTQTVELAVTFDAAKKTVTGLVIKYIGARKIAVPATINGYSGGYDRV